MRILLALTYYRPHVSGLTIYVERLARVLAKRRHQVTVLTSHYERALPREESGDGVHVIRVPVAARVSKGVLMPSLATIAPLLIGDHDVVSLHLPQFDAAALAMLGRVLRRPTILTYHCDLQLPAGLFNRIVDQVVFGANYASAILADRIVAYTQDYADHSRLLARFKSKLVIIPPPVIMPLPQPAELSTFTKEHVADGGPTIGFAARLAAEKGVEYVVQAVPELLQRFPNLKVLFAGPYGNVLGEDAYWQRLKPEIERLDGHWEFLGTLTPDQMPAFFGSCDVLVVPSLNSTESFGLVQVEAMLCGTPVVASDLPGVRQPVRMTGMGQIIPVGDARALAAAVGEILERRDEYVRPRHEIEAQFDLGRTADAYEALFEREIQRVRGISVSRSAA